MKVLLFLAKGFETIEFSAFVDVLGWARNDFGCPVDVVTCGFTKTVVSTFNIPVIVDTLIEDIDVTEYDALAIPGGFEEFGFYEEAYSDQLSELIWAFDKQHKIIATICVASLALGHCGVLKGRNGTTYHLDNGVRQQQLAEYGVNVVKEPVVVDDNIITSYCPQTAYTVAFHLLERLTDRDTMTQVQVSMGF